VELKSWVKVPAIGDRKSAEPNLVTRNTLFGLLR